MRTELTHEQENRLKLERQISETRRDIVDSQRAQLQELRQTSSSASPYLIEITVEGHGRQIPR